MMVWTGQGWGSVGLAVVFLLLGLAFGSPVFEYVLGRNGPLYGMAFGLVVAAFLNWFVGNKLNGPLREAGIRWWNQHTIYYIPMQWFSIVIMMIAIMFFAIAIIGP